MNKKEILSLILVCLLLTTIVVGASSIYVIKKTQPKIEFLHIPKNGGMYIRSLFNNKIIMRNHFESFPTNKFVSFAIIRNPFTRFQSIFAHTKRHFNETSNIRLFKSLHDIAECYYNKSSPKHIHAKNMLSWSQQKIENHYPCKITLSNMFLRRDLIDKDGSLIHFAPQSTFIYNKNKNLNFTYYLRFEYLDEDLNELIENNVLPHISYNKKRIKKNVSKKVETEVSITDLVAKLINDVYSDDIQLYKKLNSNYNKL